MRHYMRVSIFSLALFLVSGCGSDSPTPPAGVASVTVSPSQSTVLVLETTQLGATVHDPSGATLSGRTVSWSTSDASTATVSSGGLVTGVSEGTATITATAEGVSGTAQVVVGPAAVASVDITPAGGTLRFGESIQLTATPRDLSGGVLTGKTVTWSSDDAAVASVDNTGLVTSAGIGDVTITATAENGSGTAAITVALASTILSASVAEVAPVSSTVVGRRVRFSIELDELPECAPSVPRPEFGFLVDADRDAATGLTDPVFGSLGVDAQIVVVCVPAEGGYVSNVGDVTVRVLGGGTVSVDIEMTAEQLPSVDFFFAVFVRHANHLQRMPEAPHVEAWAIHELRVN